MQKVVLSFLIAFVLLMVVIVLSRITYNNSQEFSTEAEYSWNVIKQYNTIDVQIRSGEIYSTTYENSTAKDLYAIYKNDLNNIEPSLKQLKFYTKKNPEQAAIADSLEKIIIEQLPVLRSKNLIEMINTEGGVRRFDSLKKAHLLITKGLQLEEKLLRERRNKLITANQQNNLLTLLLSILAIIIITITFFQQFFLSRKSLWLEGFLESILDTTQNGIVYYKAVREKGKITDFKVEYANRAIQTLLGVDPAKVIGKKLTQLDSYVRKTDIYTKYTEVVETGEPAQFEHLYLNKGQEKWLSISITKMDDGITVAFHNISNIKRYEEDLKNNIAALEQSNTELEEYAYAASHDLQEPLRKIRTFGSFLHDTQYDRLDERGKEQLQKILQSTERMSLLIKDLLSFSSLKDKDEFVETDLNRIFENVLQDLEIMIAQKQAIVTHDPLPEIEAIPVQINQLFYNLVNNALKFAKKEIQLHLDVSCKQVDSNDIKDVPGLKPATTYYEIIFSDNGIGFNQEYAMQIFGMFKRLNDKSSYAGSGIGLSLCKKVVVNHGGVIMANGKEGVGAQFYIYLPAPVKTEPTFLQEEE
jgi:PAS domain S-box-containing protein